MAIKYLGIQIDYSRDELLTDFALATLKDRYLTPIEKSPQEAFARAAVTFSAGDKELAQRLYDHASKLHFMFATPVLSNGGTDKGMPISCFLSDVPDSRKGLGDHYLENIALSTAGGGIGSYWGGVRSYYAKVRSAGKSSGAVRFMKVDDVLAQVFSQAGTRRGAIAEYLDISHPEIESFIIMRKPTGGDPELKMLSTSIHHGVNITDAFMEAARDDKPWDLIDPHTKEVCKTVNARELWQLILETRIETGEPYIHFIDTTNRMIPQCHKEANLLIKHSNLCSEIVLPVTPERTAVCCLSSVNLEKWDEWKDTIMVRDLITMLDNVLDYFIANAPAGMEKAVHSASLERSLGLGAMGFHSFLQSKGIPFESALAESWNRKMFSHIRTEAEFATTVLGMNKGNAPDFEVLVEAIDEDGFIVYRRNVYLMAIAPNASTSIIADTSPSIEPWAANVFTHKTDSGSFQVKNKWLDKLLESKVLEAKESGNQFTHTNEIWKSILEHGGSVQHLDILSQDEKDVFKTAMELHQAWLVHHAAVRQQWIDQAQSLNLFFPGDASKSYIHSVHWKAWESGVKTLYYCRSKAVNRAEILNKQTEREIIAGDECLSCSG